MLPPDLLAWTKQITKQYKIIPGQKLGQHWLVDKVVLNKIMATADLKIGESVLEVGGGLGTLTLWLLEAKTKVVCVELDPRLVKGLEKLSVSGNLKVVSADILKVSEQRIVDIFRSESADSFSMVANLPYEITGAFLRKFLESSLPIRQMVLLLQKEVAERLSARPGQMSLLGLLAQFTSRVELIQIIKPKSFYPPPRVESALVKIIPKNSAEKDKMLQNVSWNQLWQLARTGFSAKRKQLHNNIRAVWPLTMEQVDKVFNKAGLSIKARAQELSVEQWVKLAQEFFKIVT